MTSQDYKTLISHLKRGEQIKENDIKIICDKAKEIFKKEPNLLNLSSPITICGDIHGQFEDLLELFEIGAKVPETNYLFLGDYVDRGYSSIETFLLFMILKIQYPDRINLLRGNHECQQITMQYGFYDECRRKYNSVNVWKFCCEVFNCLPLAALIDNKIFCVHGGLSPNLEKIDELLKINRFQEISRDGVMSDILWSDPEAETEGYRISPRGAGFLFGEDALERFIEENKLECVIRAHQLVMEGHKFMFNDKLITVWSAPNYCYRCGNIASILELDENTEKEFKDYEATNNEQKFLPLTKDVPEYFL